MRIVVPEHAVFQYGQPLNRGLLWELALVRNALAIAAARTAWRHSPPGLFQGALLLCVLWPL